MALVCSLTQYSAAMLWDASTIKHEREARGWSQRVLAERLSAAQPDGSVSARSITDWERGKATPTGRNLSALDRVFAVAPTTVTTVAAGTLPPGVIEAALEEASHLQLLTQLAKRLSRLGPEDVVLPSEPLRRPRADNPSRTERPARDSL